VDHPGTDVDEYVEFAGPALAPLTGHTLVVIGDGTGACGVVEVAIDLSSYSIQADGLFALRLSTGTAQLTGYDATEPGAPAAGRVENSDNLTILLVTGWTGAVAADLDTNDDGTLDSTPWATIVDQVGIYEGVAINCAGGDEYLYTSVQVGPDGMFSPGHIFRCGSTWAIGPFGDGSPAVWPSGATDTVGASNAGTCATPTTPSTWGKIKAFYR
jgi:hypothetical protein